MELSATVLCIFLVIFVVILILEPYLVIATTFSFRIIRVFGH